MMILHRTQYLHSRLATSLFFYGFVQALAQQPGILLSGAPDQILPIEAPFEMPQIARPFFADRIYNIREFGAKEGGVVKNTEAIRKAINAASKAGGGRVVVPAGRWLTGAIHLESNVDLYIAKGAELLFSQDPNDYLPAVFSRHEDTECYKYSAFIYADHKTNIAITGEGTLNGQGKPWWNWKNSKKGSQELAMMVDKNVPIRERVFDGTDGRVLRPAFFQPMNCSNILVEGVTFLYGAFWTITPTYCENIIVRKVKIITDGPYGRTPNGDGVDPSSCKNVLIEYCEFCTGDDCIAIKSGRDKDGMRVDVPTEDVVIRHCVGLQGHGGIVIGSETSGGIRNVYAFDCRFHGTERIVRIKTARGRGGTVEKMWFRNLSADTVQQEALRINMLYTGSRLPAEAVTNATPRIRDIHYSNISCSYGKKAAIEILGLPEMPVEDVTFDSIAIVSTKGIACSDADMIEFRNIAVRPEWGPLLSILDCSKINVNGMQTFGGILPMVYADGRKTRDVILMNLTGSKSNIDIQYGPNINHGAVTIQ
ncbi:MAG: glycoside hydrolase family 28 protein [Bacteroidota bacterium]